MTRTLTLTPEDAPSFVLLYNAFMLGGNALYRSQQGQRPATERRQEAKVIRELHRISVVVNPETGGRALAPAGGTLTLDQGVFALLERYVEAATLPTEVSLEHADLIDRLSAAPRVEAPGT